MGTAPDGQALVIIVNEIKEASGRCAIVMYNLGYSCPIIQIILRSIDDDRLHEMVVGRTRYTSSPALRTNQSGFEGRVVNIFNGG
ncbi:hypothetical protein M3P36_04415, partial [Altererythrobacter sp. KTW20L]|uniref:hypothetical protein n=1 Tax=Altererythrobacter sp. KTW20L TaxID=2942210 RepID=UPI0020BFC57F